MMLLHGQMNPQGDHAQMHKVGAVAQDKGVQFQFTVCNQQCLLAHDWSTCNGPQVEVHMANCVIAKREPANLHVTQNSM